MMIREANPDDFETIAEKARDFFTFSGLKVKGLKYNYNRFLDYLLTLNLLDNVKVLIAKNESEIIGSLAGTLTPWHLDTSQTILHEIWFWLDPDHRGKGYDRELINAFLQWGKDKKADFCIMASLPGFGKNMVSYYRKFGFQSLESNFIKEI